MIISHEHRYIFVEIPLTASWAIHHELCDHYGGTPILHKHATTLELEREEGRLARDYFVFAAVRNPLDSAVSGYYKLKTDHKGAFSSTAAAEALHSDYADLKRYRFVQSTGATFEEFFLRYYRRVYSSMIDLSAAHLDHVIRFEDLQQGFAHVLRHLGLDPVRPLPRLNETRGRGADWESFYTPATIPRAKAVFGPFLARWGYSFPADWGPHAVSPVQQLRYQFSCVAKRFYMTHFRYSHSPGARAVRRLRARLLS